MTGFRVALGGAQQRFGIQPDLTTLGKIIGGGLPMAAYGGRADIMNKVAPVGPDLSGGHAVGQSAGGGGGTRDAAVSEGASGGLRRARSARRAADGVDAAGVTVNRVGSMFTFFFTPEPVTDWESAKTIRHGERSSVLPLHAGARRLSRALAVRGWLRVRSALTDEDVAQTKRAVAAYPKFVQK